MKEVIQHSEVEVVVEIVAGQYRHFKGDLYQVYGIATHSETSERVVVYRPLYGEGALWVRPLSMFVEHVEYEGGVTPRFSLVNESGN